MAKDSPRRDDAPKRDPAAGKKHVSDLHRLLRVLTLVQSGPGWTAARLAKEMGVTERTVFRDIKKLQGVGIPLSARPGGKGFQVRGETFLQPLQLTTEEAIALAVLCEEIASHDQIAFLRPALRALEKVQAQLPPALREEVRSVAGNLVIRTGPAAPGEQYADVYDRLREALQSRRAVECEYERLGGESDGAFTFEPYALVYSVRAWYAVGRHAGKNALRTFRLSRFVRVTPLQTGYEIPRDFTITRHFGNAWRMIRGTPEYRVEIEFAAPLAERISETLWHPTQEVESRPDGTALFRCTVAGLDEIVWWVLEMGPDARVLAPPELAERVRDLATRTATRYTPLPPTAMSASDPRRRKNE